MRMKANAIWHVAVNCNLPEMAIKYLYSIVSEPIVKEKKKMKKVQRFHEENTKLGSRTRVGSGTMVMRDKAWINVPSSSGSSLPSPASQELLTMSALPNLPL